MLAKRECQSKYMWLTNRIREQARSHRGCVLGQAFLVRGRKIANTPSSGRNEHR
ncbi:hypothetical protein D3C86_1824870 [compost metagenome]